jgi:hypothetical protein
MRKFLRATMFMIGMAITSACAGGSGGGSGGAETYRESLGQATPYDFSRFTHQILDRYQYEVERSDSSASVHVIRTRWRHRYPFDDEIFFGGVDAMTRFVIQARTRGGAGTSGASSLRAVEFIAENQVLMGETNEWRPNLMTDMFRDYVKQITLDLKTEFRGMRVY